LVSDGTVSLFDVYFDGGQVRATDGRILLMGILPVCIATYPGQVTAYSKKLQGYRHNYAEYEGFSLKRAIEAEEYTTQLLHQRLLLMRLVVVVMLSL